MSHSNNPQAHFSGQQQSNTVSDNVGMNNQETTLGVGEMGTLDGGPNQPGSNQHAVTSQPVSDVSAASQFEGLNALLLKEVTEHLLTIRSTCTSCAESLEKSSKQIVHLESRSANLETENEVGNNSWEKLAENLNSIQTDVSNIQAVYTELATNLVGSLDISQRVEKQVHEDSLQESRSSAVDLTGALNQIKDGLLQVSTQINQLSDRLDDNMQNFQLLLLDVSCIKDMGAVLQQKQEDLKESLGQLKNQMENLKKCSLEMSPQVDHIRKCIKAQGKTLKSLGKEIDDLLEVDLKTNLEDQRRRGDQLEGSVNELRAEMSICFDDQKRRDQARENFMQKLALGLDEKEIRDDELEVQVGQLREDVTICKTKLTNIEGLMTTIMGKLDTALAAEARSQTLHFAEDESIAVTPRSCCSANTGSDGSDKSDSGTPPRNHPSAHENESQVKEMVRGESVRKEDKAHKKVAYNFRPSTYKRKRSALYSDSEESDVPSVQRPKRHVTRLGRKTVASESEEEKETANE